MKKSKILGLGTLALAGVLAFTGCGGVKDEEGKAWAEENGYIKDAAKWAEENGYVKAEDYNIDLDADVTTGGSDTADVAGTQISNEKKLELLKDYLRGAVLYYKDAQGNKYAPKVDTTTTPHSRVEGKAVAVSYKFMYKANEACTVGGDAYTAGQEIEASVYEAMGETDKAKFTKVTKTVYGEEKDVVADDLEAVYSYREMYPIATSYNNNPGLATAEFWIDLDTMKLYSFSEKGTEKVLYIENNPAVELYFTKQVEEKDYVAEGSSSFPGGTDYWRSYGVQIKGTAKVLDSAGADADVFNSIVSKYAETMYGYEAWASKVFDGSAATIPALYSRIMNCIEITPDEYVINSLWARYVTEADKEEWKMSSAGHGLDVFDKWAEELVGKDVRQTYVPSYED